MQLPAVQPAIMPRFGLMRFGTNVDVRRLALLAIYFFVTCLPWHALPYYPNMRQVRACAKVGSVARDAFLKRRTSQEGHP